MPDPGAPFDEGTLKAVANLKRQDHEFCRILRLAIGRADTQRQCLLNEAKQP
jgi:hypothetical protein